MGHNIEATILGYLDVGQIVDEVETLPVGDAAGQVLRAVDGWELALHPAHDPVELRAKRTGSGRYYVTPVSGLSYAGQERPHSEEQLKAAGAYDRAEAPKLRKALVAQHRERLAAAAVDAAFDALFEHLRNEAEYVDAQEIEFTAA